MANFREQTGANNPFNGVDVGSFSAPTFADIDGDGDSDAFIGANDGTIRYYRNDGGTFSNQIGTNNPFNGVDVGISSFPTFADIDADGDLDAFIGEQEGTIRYYRNDEETFSEQIGTSNPLNGVDVGNWSSPTFTDIDADRDLDAFIGAFDGTIRYYRNNGGTFSNQNGTSNPFNGVNVTTFSTLTFADIDSDGDSDAFIGAYDGTIRYYRNDGGTFSNQTGSNPFISVRVDYSSAPTFADIDSDGDLEAFIGERNGIIRYYQNIAPIVSIAAGTSPSEAEPTAPIPGNFVVTLSQAAAVDLIISYTVTGTATAGSDYSALTGSVTIAAGQTSANINVAPLLDSVVDPGETFQLTLTTTATAGYNLGSAKTAVLGIADQVPQTFTEVAGAGNPLNGVNVGSFSTPTFADIDGDGDRDAFIGANDGTIPYYRNDGGTFSNQTGTNNPLNGVDVGSWSTPTFADIDSDGDSDAFIGERFGTIRYYRNDGGTFSNQSGISNPLNGVDVGLSSAPTFADIDGDGDSDAFIGALDGTIRYYRNTGGTFSNQTGTSNPFNAIDVGSFSKPTFADIDGDGDLDAFIGAEDTIRYYRNTGGTFSNQTGTNNPFNAINVGYSSAPTFADIDGDGDLDAFIGESGGTVRYYENAPIVSIATGTSPREAGTAGTFTVTLSNPAPDGGITVAYTVAGTATGGSDYTALSGSVSFAAGATTATINVIPSNDAIIDPNETLQVTLTDAASYNLAATPNNTATLTIEDNDIGYAIVAGTATVAEGSSGTTPITYTITRTGRTDVASSVDLSFGGTATNNTDYTLAGVAGTGITNTGNTVNFAADATTATVTLDVAGDVIDEDNETLQISLTLSTTPVGFQATVPVATPATTTITDDDTAGFTITNAGAILNTTEAGGTATFTVALNSQPTANVTIAFSSSNSAEGVVTPSITFNSTNWNTPQTVTLTGINDNVIDGSIAYQINGTISTSDAKYSALTFPSVSASNSDNDIEYAIASGTSTVAEGNTGNTTPITYTITRTGRTDVASSVDITLGGTASNGSDYNNLQATGTGITLTGNTINFAAGATQATLTLNAVGDVIDEDNETLLVSLSPSNTPADFQATVPVATSVNRTIIDDDNAGFSMTPGDVFFITSEAGGTGTFTIQLNTQPTADVTITFSSSNTAEGTITPSVTFNSTNWNTPQTVTLTGIDDNVVDGLVEYQITGTVSSTDTKYSALTFPLVFASNTDNDSAGITITQSAGNTLVTETGTTDTYTIALNTIPTGSVEITATADSQTLISLDGTTFSNSVTFTRTNTTAQTITVRAINDSVVENNQVGTITHTISNSGASEYPTTLAINPVTVNITDANQPPTLTNISKPGTEDSAITFTATDFTGAFSDVNGNSLTRIQIVSLPSSGSLTLSGVAVTAGDEIDTANLGNLTFTPTPNFNGIPSFNWNGFDGTTYATTNATVNLNIAAVNDPPTVSNIAKVTDEDTTITFTSADFTGTFSDVDANSLTKIQITTLPSNGTLSLNGVAVVATQEIDFAALGNLTFTPPANFTGSTSFNWNGSDGTAYAAAGATVNLTINSVNDLPVLSNISKSSNEDTAISFTAADFTNAFSDADGNSLTKIKITALPGNGNLTLNGVSVTPNQEIAASDLSGLTFTPNANFNGNVSFGWNGFDGTSYSTNPAQISLTVNPINDLPVVSTVSKTGSAGTAITFTSADFQNAFGDLDNDALGKIQITSLPGNGSLTLNGAAVTASQEIDTAALANLAFTPNAGFSGVITFGWNGFDGTAYAAAGATVSLAVDVINTAPTVGNISKAGNENTDIAFTAADFTSQFTDADNNPLSKVKITSLPTNGTLKLSGVSVTANQEIAAAALGNLGFSPNANFDGTTSFTWNAFDGIAYATTGASVNITVNNVNNLPVVSTVVKQGDEDTTIGFSATDFTGAFGDVDGENLAKIQLTSLPQNGALTLAGTVVMVNQEIAVAELNNLSLTPNANFNGAVTFNWNGSDGTAYAATGSTVSLNIQPVNDPPTLSAAINDQIAVQNIGFNFTVVENTFTDVDGDTLTYSASLENGEVLPSWLSFNPTTRTFSGTPAADNLGAINVKGTASDGVAGASDTFTLTVNAKPNTAPVVATPISDRTATAGTLFSYTFAENTFVDADGDALSYMVTLADGSALPAWLSFDAQTRTISGTPAANNLGAINLKVSASDGVASASDVFSLTVNATPNTAPTVSTPIADRTATAGTLFSYTFAENTFVDADGDALTYTLTLADGSPLPTWLNFDAQNRTISGTPPSGTAETFAILVTALDTAGASAGDSFNLVVSIPTPEPGEPEPINTSCLCDLFPTPNLVAGSIIPNLVENNINGNNDEDFLVGSLYGEALFSENANDIIVALEDNDNVYGGDGNDLLFGNLGTDYIDADVGNDIAFGGQDADGILGGEGDDIVLGDIGNDTIKGGVGNDLLFGNRGDDFIEGKDGKDTIFGGKDQDALLGGNGDDIVLGDIGNDTIVGGAGNDLLFGNVGADFMDGGEGNDTIFGGKNNDILKGSLGDDILLGDIGNDTVCGSEGNDILFGNIGNDIMDGCEGDDSLYGGKDNDTLIGNVGNDLLNGDLGDDSLYGNIGSDTLNGGNGNDSLCGGKENDFLYGDNGDDVLNGDLGTDILTGGAGSDRFVLKSGAGSDTITDFTDGEDLLVLSAGLSFANLTITSGSSATLISVGDELLVTLNQVEASLITVNDFVQV